MQQLHHHGAGSTEKNSSHPSAGEFDGVQRGRMGQRHGCVHAHADPRPDRRAVAISSGSVLEKVMIIRWNSPLKLLKSVLRTIRYLVEGRPIFAPKQVQDERYAICRGCKWHLDGQCTVCTCFTSMKVILSGESCPDNPPRWKKLTFSKPVSTKTTVA